MSNKAAMIDHGGESTDALGPLADGMHRGINWESIPKEALDKQGYILAEDYNASDGVVYWGRRTFTSPHDGVIWINSCVVGTWLGWKMLATATPPQQFDLPLAEGLIQSSASWYSKDQFNQVHVHGAISAGSGSLGWDTLVATLPEGYRPSEKVEAAATFASGGTSGSGAVAVSADGTIKVFPDISATQKVVYFDLFFLASGLS